MRPASKAPAAISCSTRKASPTPSASGPSPEEIAAGLDAQVQKVREALDGGIFAGYPERASPIPGCGEDETEYAELQLFVAFYCNVGDFMAYDDGDGPDSLLTPLADTFGAAVMAAQAAGHGNGGGWMPWLGSQFLG